MSKAKVVNRSEILNDRERILSALEEHIKGIVVDVLQGVTTHLEQELEIAQAAGVKGRHQRDRAYSRFGTG